MKKVANSDPEAYFYFVSSRIHKVILMNRPVVSIVFPVYNSEKYLRQFLDIAVNQSLTELEIEKQSHRIKNSDKAKVASGCTRYKSSGRCELRVIF